MSQIMRETASLCPICLKQLPARHILMGDDIYLEKSCPEHGSFSTVIWRNNTAFPMAEWRGDAPALDGNNPPPCPESCGLCTSHIQDTCCVLVEVTRRCNLGCPYCLAGDCGDADLPLAEIKARLLALSKAGKSFLQLSGGEPTLRDDLPQIVRYAKEDCGFTYVQLNTNGLRLGTDKDFLLSLKHAGLSFVFLQFDGIYPQIYETLRGKDVLQEKQAAIDACGRLDLGVTLVCTVVPGVNLNHVGQLLEYAISRSPVVRGVHFHPVSYFGRYPAPPDNEMRVTLPEVILALQTQTGNLITPDLLTPSCCDHPLCGFHGDFVVLPDGGLQSLGRSDRGESCCSPVPAAEKSRRFVGRRWERRDEDCCCGEPEDVDISSFDGFLSRVKSHGFTVTAMAFQDAYNIDLERLRHCSLHVAADDGKLMPLCVRYLTQAAL